MRTSSVRGRMEAEHPEGPRPCSGLPPAAGTRSAVRAGRGAEAGMEESVGRLDVFGAPRSPTVTTQAVGGNGTAQRGAGGNPPPYESRDPVERGVRLGFVFARLLGAAHSRWRARARGRGDGTGPVPVPRQSVVSGAGFGHGPVGVAATGELARARQPICDGLTTFALQAAANQPTSFLPGRLAGRGRAHRRRAAAQRRLVGPQGPEGLVGLPERPQVDLEPFAQPLGQAAARDQGLGGDHRQHLQPRRVAQFQQAPEPLGGAAFAAAVASQGRVRGFRLGGGRRGVRLARPPAPDRRPLVGQPTVRGAGPNAGLNRRVVRRGAVGAHRPVRRPADQARHCPPHGDSRVLGETVTPRRR